MKKTTIELGDSAAAVAVFPAATDGAAEVVRALELPPHQAVLLLLGAADSLDPALLPRLAQLFGRGIARAALEAGAVILDGGTQAGVMALMGEGVAGRGGRTPLLGVAPARLVAYPGSPTTGPALEPHHSHFVLVEGASWGSETPLLFQLAAALAGPSGAARRSPTLVLVVGGGAITCREVVRAVRQRLPILVVAGSGGLADELAAAWPTRYDALPDDPVLAEILAEGTLQFYPLAGSAQGLAQRIIRELGTDSSLLQAWETFADYDFNANLQQRRFDRLQQAIIGLGVAGAGLAIAQQLYAPRAAGSPDLLPPPDLWRTGAWGWWGLRQLLLLVPIALTVLVTAASRFKQGSKWLLLRAGAEAVKREIYRYRTQTGAYQRTAESQLAQRVEEITRRTMRTEVNTASLVPYDKNLGFPPAMGDAQPGDDGWGSLSPERYVAGRLGGQLAYFRRKAVQLEKQLRRFSWLTFSVGGLGTYLAAVGQEIWIALTTALVAAMGSYLGYRQTESTLTKYNQAATDLANVRAWWNALLPDEQLLQANVDLLVAHTEQVLQAEQDGWVQQMQNTLAELHKSKADPAPHEQPAPQVPAPAAASYPPPAAPPQSAALAVAPEMAPTAAPARPAAVSSPAPAAASEPEEALTADAELPDENAAAEEPEPELATADADLAGPPTRLSRNGRA